MKVSLLQENLAKGVGAVSKMVASKAQLPVLENILITTETGKIKLGATNLETGINLWLRAKVEEKGKITIPARVFTELVNSLPQDTVRLEIEADKLKIGCGTFTASINGIAAEEFPTIPTLSDTKKTKAESFNISKEKLEEAIKQVAFAAGIDEARPIFTGVKIEIKGKQIRLAATDGYRLSVKKITGTREVEKITEMVVPARALMALAKLIDQAEEGGEVLVAATDEERQLILAMDSVEIVTRLLEGDFPDFEKIIPASTTTSIELDKDELWQAVRAAAIFARDSANIVKFRIIGSSLKISANAPQVGENEAILEGEKSGEDAEIAFNSRYLLEMLSVVAEERLRLEMTGALNPGVFKIVGDKSFLHIIMPVRVQT